jgi:hypothetical protein
MFCAARSASGAFRFLLQHGYAMPVFDKLGSCAKPAGLAPTIITWNFDRSAGKDLLTSC